MAGRPVFVPKIEGLRLVQEIDIPFLWHSGMAPSQKKKNIISLHEAAAKRGLTPLLEISTKSEEKLGQRLSAFNLKIKSKVGEISLECAFQGSKIFEQGGPYTDLYFKDSREAKRDSRLQESGHLIGFQFEDQEFPILPKTAFYDWLYVKALFNHRDYLKRLQSYMGFTDIEFNPQRSINCQARSCAMFVALDKKDLLKEAYESVQRFIEILAPDSLTQPHSSEEAQGRLFE